MKTRMTRTVIAGLFRMPLVVRDQWPFGTREHWSRTTSGTQNQIQFTRAIGSVLALVLLMTSITTAADKRPMTVNDLLAVKGVGSPQISPDGSKVVYVVSEIDREANKTNSSLWMVSTDGGEPTRLTTSPGTNNEPTWSPDGKSVAFVSDRGGSGQIWVLPLDGGEARQLTKLPVDVSGPICSPKGDRIAFVAEVYPGSTPEETKKKDDEKAKLKTSAKVFDSLMVRHWTRWDEGKRSHLFVCDAKTGEAKDLIPDWKANVPPAPFGGSTDYAWSPDGTELAFTSEPLEDHAWSTNTDIWTIPAAGGQPKNVTEENKGGDGQPTYSPDGGKLAFLRMKRAGFEADQTIVTVLDRATGKTTELTKALDRPVSAAVWLSKDELGIVFDTSGTQTVARVPAEPFDAKHPAIVIVSGQGTSGSLSASRDGKRVAFTRNQAAQPSEVFFAEGQPERLTHHNDSLIDALDVSEAESFVFQGANGDPVSGWVVRPPGFDKSKKFPVLFLIHGGPQGAWHDDWHSRWNYQLFAAPGYALVAINPRGSTGYGQKFTDQISQDWAGKVYEDLFKGLDAALKKYPFLDGDKMAALGGSYGGYMVNWIAGHPEQKRFKTLISHAGLFDLTSMNVTTEELWFPEWEFGGSPWETPEKHRELSPSTYAKDFQDADAGHPRSARLSCARRSGAGHVHSASASGRAEPVCVLSG